jgi:hypothetical protein
MSTTVFGTLNDASGTIASGGTAQVALTPTQPLRYLRIVNQSVHPLYVDFGVAATAASIPLSACTTAGDGTGGVLEFKPDGMGFMPSAYLSLYGGTTAAAYTVKYG